MNKSKEFSIFYEIKGTLDTIIVENERDVIFCVIDKKVKSEFVKGLTYLYSSSHAAWFTHNGNDTFVTRLSELKLASSHFEMVQGEDELYRIIFKTKTIEGEPFEIQTGSYMII